MASSFQQQSLIRKGIYAGLILALFTGSYLFRSYVVEDGAEQLGLREETRGEVELSSSAVRLVLTGSRGLATCFLWVAVKDRQARREWNEMELLVKSVTKLQPHFITPWLFQSWNIAFNVSWECDDLHDKYFYISEGIKLLADGENRNRGSKGRDGEIRVPANPDMRFMMAFYYQLKIGQSDENRTMRSLFQLSCIKPQDRKPENLEISHSDGQKEVNLGKFEDFCRDHPRLVRRLREQLPYDTPEKIIGFLRDHQDVPSRFHESGAKKGELKERALDRFPLSPPKFQAKEEFYDLDIDTEKQIPPEGKRRGDDFDNFVAQRAWYIYAQEPLPEPDEAFGADGYHFDKQRHRLPRMNNYIFRQFPALTEAEIARQLAADGWFDSEGWSIFSLGGKEPWFFEGDNKDIERPVTVGKDPKYSSRRAWERAYLGIWDYGKRTGLGLPEGTGGPPRMMSYRQLNARKGTDPRALDTWNSMLLMRTTTNFENHFYEAEAERDPQAIKARQHLFEAEQLYGRGNNWKALQEYDRWLVEWTKLLTRKEKFRENDIVQEEAYEKMLIYFRRFRHPDQHFLRPFLTDMALSNLWPTSGSAQFHKEEALKKLFTLKEWRGIGIPPNRFWIRQQPSLRPFLAELALSNLWPTRGAVSLHNEKRLEQLFTRDEWQGIAVPPNFTGPFDEEIAKDQSFFKLEVIDRVWDRLVDQPARMRLEALRAQAAEKGSG